MTAYRREIDGLRALAVIPVVLFHAGLELFSGGFVGVDVFFVISGYLITSIILGQLDAGTFSLSRFYERRARRILPALFLVVACSCVAAWFLLIPPDMEDFARSVSYIPVFWTNVFFYGESGYFDTAAEWKPLLHTWSLAVEEQYYVLFPLLMLFLWKRGRALIPWVFLMLGAASLLAAEWMLGQDREAVFFLLQFRIWELLVGAGIAWFGFKRKLPSASAGLLSGLGLMLILFPVFAFDEATRFPGVHALIPVLGAALVVMYASPLNPVGRLLGWWPLVGIGLISYSAYLWHQPVLSFVRHATFDKPEAAVMLAGAVCSFLLAYPSWRFVERPFRKQGAISRRALIYALGALAVAAIAFGAMGRSTEGYEQRSGVNERFPDMSERLRRNPGLSYPCEGVGERPVECRTHDRPELLLWGDSYAMHLAKGLVAENPDIRMVQYTKSACGPVLDVAPARAGNDGAEWKDECIGHNDQVIEYLEASDSIRYVVLGSFFYYYLESESPLVLRDGSVMRDQLRATELVRSTVARILQSGKQVVIVAPTPRAGDDYGRCLARAAFLDEYSGRCDFAREEWEQRYPGTVQALMRLGESVRVIWLADAICPDGVCRPEMDGVVIYRDDGHLSVEGSSHLGRKMGWFRQFATPFEPVAPLLPDMDAAP